MSNNIPVIDETILKDETLLNVEPEQTEEINKNDLLYKAKKMSNMESNKFVKEKPRVSLQIEDQADDASQDNEQDGTMQERIDNLPEQDVETRQFKIHAATIEKEELKKVDDITINAQENYKEFFQIEETMALNKSSFVLNQNQMEGALAIVTMVKSDLMIDSCAYLKWCMKQKDSLLLFIAIIVNHREFKIRQVACVILRNKVIELLNSNPKEICDSIKMQLIQALTNESNVNVRKAISELVITIASLQDIENPWKELISFISENMQAEETDKRRMGSFLFMTLMIDPPNIFNDQQHQLIETITNRLGIESELDITIMNIKLLVQQAITLTSDELIENWCKCINSILTVLKNFVEGHKEEQLEQVFQIIIDCQDLTFNPNATKIFKKNQVQEFLDLAQAVLSNENISLKIRKQGLDLIEVICRCRKDLLKNKTNQQKIIEQIFIFASVDQDEELKMDMLDYSMGVLDSFSHHCSIIMFQATLTQLVNEFTRSDLPKRKAVGYCSLGVVSSACHEVMRMDVPRVFNYLKTGTEDQDVFCKIQALQSLSTICLTCRPEIVDLADKIITVLIDCQGSPNQINQVKERSIETLIYFIDGCEFLNIKPYLEQLVNFFNEQWREATDQAIRGLCLRLAGAIFAKGGRECESYQDTLQDVVNTCIFNGEQLFEHPKLLAEIISAYSYLLLSMDEKKLRAFVEGYPQFHASLANIYSNANEHQHLTLIESVHEFQGNVIQLMRDDFAYIDDVVEPLFKIIGEDTCFQKHQDKEENKVQFMSDKINQEEIKQKEIVIKVTGLEAIQSAMWLLSLTLDLLPLQTQKQRNQVIKMINNWKDTNNELMKRMLIRTWCTYVVSLAHLNQINYWIENYNSENKTTFIQTDLKIQTFEKEQGQDFRDAAQIGNEALAVCKLFVDQVLQMIKFENDFGVVDECISSLARLFRCLNQHFVSAENNEIDQICDTFRLLMHRDCSFQMGTADLPFENEEAEAAEDSFENQAQVYLTVEEMVSEMLRCYKETFSYQFDITFRDSLFEKTKPTALISEKLFCLRLFGSSFKQMSAHMSNFIEETIMFSDRMLRDPNEFLQQEVIKLLGYVAEGCALRAKEFQGKIGNLLEPYLSTGHSFKLKKIKDAVISTQAKMIFSNETLVPNCENVTEIVTSNTPLEYDKEENVTLLEMQYYMIKTYKSFASSKVNDLFNMAVYVLNDRQNRKQREMKEWVKQIQKLMQNQRLTSIFDQNRSVMNMINM